MSVPDPFAILFFLEPSITLGLSLSFSVIDKIIASCFAKQEAIILSMTEKERDNPRVIDGSRKKRIAILFFLEPSITLGLSLSFSVIDKIIASCFAKQEAIILSMTEKERDNPRVIDGSRKKRIANGSGTDISMVNKLLKQHKMMTTMMKKMSKGGRGALEGMDNVPPELFNNLK